MEKEIDEINWDLIMQKLSSYEGVLTDFCKENKIKPHQLYYRRKKLKAQAKATFHAISLNKEDNIKAINLNSHDQEAKNIKIELGKANIYIPTNDALLLSNVIKELAKTC